MGQKWALLQEQIGHAHVCYVHVEIVITIAASWNTMTSFESGQFQISSNPLVTLFVDTCTCNCYICKPAQYLASCGALLHAFMYTLVFWPNTDHEAIHTGFTVLTVMLQIVKSIALSPGHTISCPWRSNDPRPSPNFSPWLDIKSGSSLGTRL